MPLQVRREERARTGSLAAVMPRPRREAATRTSLRQLLTSVARSGIATARAWTRAKHVVMERKIRTARGSSSRTVAAEASPVPCENLQKIRWIVPLPPRAVTVLGGADQNREAIVREKGPAAFATGPFVLIPSP